MPVHNVPVIPSIDLSPLAPLTFGSVDCVSIGVDSSDSEPQGFEPDLNYRLGGEIVNTATPGEDATIYILALPTDALAPTKSEVISNGMILLPGGSYQLTPRANFGYFFAAETGGARVVCHTFGA
jgi:hypothetical protein